MNRYLSESLWSLQQWLKMSGRKCAPILNMIVEMKGNSFVDSRRNRGKCPCMILAFVVSSNTGLHFNDQYARIGKNKVTYLIVYKLFVWISVKGSEKAHNVRILTTLSTIIWRKTMVSYFLFASWQWDRQSEAWNNSKMHPYLSKFVPRSIETTDDCSRPRRCG